MLSQFMSMFVSFKKSSTRSFRERERVRERERGRQRQRQLKECLLSSEAEALMRFLLITGYVSQTWSGLRSRNNSSCSLIFLRKGVGIRIFSFLFYSGCFYVTEDTQTGPVLYYSISVVCSLLLSWTYFVYGSLTFNNYEYRRSYISLAWNISLNFVGWCFHFHLIRIFERDIHHFMNLWHPRNVVAWRWSIFVATEL